MATSELAIEYIIRKKVNGSTWYLLLGLAGVPGIFLFPLAYIRCGQALQLIDQHGVGKRYRKQARQVRIAIIALSAMWISLALYFICTVVICN